ncbi:glycosyltransferase [Brevundimonas denitrificans]|uniref:Glycosyltransferase n=1 Tax=Brevundimonas denitrificans TaxID=1443434 RepID=A0ABQ6BFH7_9CAUL|nr:glycosyltransferase [Brevundimonas denitrificans]GLS00177.1 glycosyltransferase [Brevundimonas denitrificans]
MTGTQENAVKGRLNLHVFLSSVESETRLFKEARYTLEQGIFDRVVVVGLWAKDLKRSEVTSYGLEIERLTVLIRRYGDAEILRRLPILRKVVAAISMLQFYSLAVRRARQLRPSHVSCHNLMLLPLAWTAARLSGSRLVYVPHELEARRAGLGTVMQKLHGMMERAFIKAASQVVVVCEPIAEWYRDRYGLANVHVVRNVPERDALELRKVSSGDFRHRFNISDDATVFIYQGLFGRARGTDRLLEIFSGLEPELCHLVLMGYGEGTDQLEVDEFVSRHSNIHHQPAVPREWIISYTSGADIGLIVVDNAPLSYRHSLPNKFFEYVHAGLPVLVSDNLQHLSEILEAGGIGWSVPYDEIRSKILELTRTRHTVYRERAREFASNAVWEADARVYETVYRS